MALPPERVSIKRKRDAESVDVLFIQDSKRQRNQFVFKRLKDVRSTTTSFPSDARENVAPSIETEPPGRPQTPSFRSRVELKTRRFHLERPNQHSGAVAKPGSAEDPSKKKLAVLVEKSTRKRHLAERLVTEASRGRPTQHSLPSSPKKPLLDAPKHQQQQQLQQLRPRASAAELRWREEKWGPRGSASRSVSRGPTPAPGDAQELKLAQQLDAFALEQEIKAVAGNPKAAVETSSPRKKPLKFQPKPSAAGRKISLNAESMHSEDSDDSVSDYEYDTFVRVPYEGAADEKSESRAEDMDIEMVANDPALAGQTIGVLVIEDEDEDLWATFQELDESEDEYEIDDEDENAEDYYGNDYPEDELDSEDEYGRGAYGHRYAGSDDEQYGDGLDEDDDSAVSGDELPASRTPQAQISGSWVNEFASPVQNRGLHPY